MTNREAESANPDKVKIVKILKRGGIGPFDYHQKHFYLGPGLGKKLYGINDDDYVGRAGKVVGSDYGFDPDTEEEYRTFEVAFDDGKVGFFSPEEIDSIS